MNNKIFKPFLNENTDTLNFIRYNTIGKNKKEYFDYTATGLAFRQIENRIHNVLENFSERTLNLRYFYNVYVCVCVSYLLFVIFSTGNALLCPRKPIWIVSALQLKSFKLFTVIYWMKYTAYGHYTKHKGSRSLKYTF